MGAYVDLPLTPFPSANPWNRDFLIFSRFRAWRRTRNRSLLGAAHHRDSQGLQAPPLYSNHDLLIADDVPGITHSILRLLGDDELRKSMAENGLRRVTHDFS